MYCKKCGALIPDQSRFCSHCGTSLSIASTPSIVNPQTVQKLEGLFGINLSKKVIGIYLLWFLIHLVILLVNWDVEKYANRKFWPFSKNSEIDDYNMTEFLLYTIVPLVGIVTVNLFSTRAQNDKTSTSKYDETYKSPDEPVVIGTVLLVLSIIISLAAGRSEDESMKQNLRAVLSFFAIFIRIGVTIWVVSLAKKQNRDTFGWGFFAFVAPSIALISIGRSKKLKMP